MRPRPSAAKSRSIERKLTEFEQKADELDRAINAFLMEGNETAAAAAQSRLNSTQRLVETYREQVERQRVEFRNLLDAKVKLEARLATMKQEREELQALLELAKSKETTVKAMKSLDDLMGSGDSDISGIAESIYARLDKASTASARCAPPASTSRWTRCWSAARWMPSWPNARGSLGIEWE